jgi:hypothetical protein
MWQVWSFDDLQVMVEPLKNWPRNEPGLVVQDDEWTTGAVALTVVTMLGGLEYLTTEQQ